MIAAPAKISSAALRIRLDLQARRSQQRAANAGSIARNALVEGNPPLAVEFQAIAALQYAHARQSLDLLLAVPC